MGKPIVLASSIVVVGSVLLSVANAQPFANARSAQSQYLGGELRPAAQCEQLNTRGIADVVEIAARTVAAEGNTPAHCRVSGLLAPEIAFEVNLPSPWNGRLFMIGNGGHAGEELDNPGRVAQRRQALENGFAMAQTNTGHFASKEPSATFVLSNPQKALDYAYRAVHLTAVTVKEVANRYYARPVSKAYWNSCSNGGRQGLIEAQRYPEDFDGIVANAPWVDQTGFTPSRRPTCRPTSSRSWPTARCSSATPWTGCATASSTIRGSARSALRTTCRAARRATRRRRCA
jgi:hypothetical protein